MMKLASKMGLRLMTATGVTIGAKAQELVKVSRGSKALVPAVGATATTLGVVTVVLVILGAEQMYKLIAPVPMEHGSYFSGGILEAWRGTVSPAATALMYVVLLLIRVVFLKFELWLAARGSTQARH